MTENKDEKASGVVMIANPVFNTMRTFCKQPGRKRNIGDYATEAVREKLERDGVTVLEVKLT